MEKICANCGKDITNSHYGNSPYCNKCKGLLRNKTLIVKGNPYIETARQRRERLGTTDFSERMCRYSSGKPNFESEMYLVQRQKDYILNKKGKKYGYTITEGDIIRGVVPKDV
jgi:hypothetical protein